MCAPALAGSVRNTNTELAAITLTTKNAGWKSAAVMPDSAWNRTESSTARAPIATPA